MLMIRLARVGARKQPYYRIVVIEKMDRLARDLMVSESILADFKRKGITLISVMEPDLCSSDPTRVLMRHMLAAFAQYERSMIVAKLNAGRARNRSLGLKAEGRFPYGSHPKPPEEAEILEAMRQMKAAGMKLSWITKKLNELGHMARGGKPWHPYTVSRIINHLRT